MAKDREGYYTAEGVDVEPRIDDGRTVFITDLKKADAYAYGQRSYKYEVFTTPHSSSRKLIGYGIPK